MNKFIIEHLEEIIKSQDPHKKLGYVSLYYCTDIITTHSSLLNNETTSITIYNFGLFTTYEDCESVVGASKIDFSNSVPCVVDGYYYRVKL